MTPTLRADPLLNRGLERRPLDEATDRASASTFSSLENAASPRALYRVAQACVDQFIASYATPPAVIVVALDHSEDAAHGQQERLFYNHHSGSYCYLPLCIFEGLSGYIHQRRLAPW